jgi:hypothetical protein
VAVRGDQLEALVLDHHQEPVQVVADVLLRHGVLHQAKELAQRLLRQRKPCRLAGGLGEPRKILGRQGLEHEPALAGLDEHALVLLLQRHLGALGQGAQDVDELARAHGHGARLSRGLDRAAGRDLDLDVGREERKAARAALDQDIGQDGQRVAAFDDSADGRERPQQFVALRFHQDHCCSFFYLTN